MKLTSSFLEDLFVLLYKNKKFLKVCCNHLKYQFIPKELVEYKLILKSILNQFELTGELPLIGVTSQQYESNEEVQEALINIKNSDVVKNSELMIKELELYIKNVEFQILNEKVVDLYKKGKYEEAILLNAEESQKIIKISLRNELGKFTKIFEDFEKNMFENRALCDLGKSPKVPFSIDPIDDLVGGGMDESETALIVSPSGLGKSTFLKWVGMQSTLLGYEVLHIQLEGSKKEAVDKYNQIWTNQSFYSIKTGNITGENESEEIKIKNRIKKAILQMNHFSRDIFVYAFETFGGASMVDVRELILEYERIKGKFPDLILIDSLDLLNTGINNLIDTNPSYHKHKLQKIAQLMKNIAVEFKTRIIVSTQSGDIPPQNLNDPDFCITRHNVEGDRTLIKPFSYVFSWNMTLDEEKKKTGRIYIDKLRNYFPKNRVFPICTNFKKGAFYSRSLTLKKFYNN